MNTSIKIILGVSAICLLGIVVCLYLRTANGNTNQNGETTDTLAVKRVHNLIILDESGSMSGLDQVSVNGVNETIQTNKEAHLANPEQEQLFTMVTFSTSNGIRITHHYD